MSDLIGVDRQELYRLLDQIRPGKQGLANLGPSSPSGTVLSSYEVVLRLVGVLERVGLLYERYLVMLQHDVDVSRQVCERLEQVDLDLARAQNRRIGGGGGMVTFPAAPVAAAPLPIRDDGTSVPL